MSLVPNFLIFMLQSFLHYYQNINLTDLSKLSLVHLVENFISIIFDNFIYNSISKKINILFYQIFLSSYWRFSFVSCIFLVASEIVLPSPWIWINILNNKYWINMEFKRIRKLRCLLVKSNSTCQTSQKEVWNNSYQYSGAYFYL